MAIVPAGVYLRLDEVPGVARGIKKWEKVYLNLCYPREIHPGSLKNVDGQL